MYKTVEEKIQSAAFPRLKSERQFGANVLPLLQSLIPVRMMADGVVPEARVWNVGTTSRIIGYCGKASDVQLPGGIHTGAKIKQLIEDITSYPVRDETNKFVIFSEFREVQAAIRTALERAGHRTLTLEGSMSAVKRGKIIQQFAEDVEVSAMVFSMRLGACGLTLTMANVVVLFEVGVDHALELQAVNRIHRIGQTRPVETLTYVTEDTVDERMMTVRHRRGLPRYFGDLEKIKKEKGGTSFTKLDEMRILFDWSPC
ncbi:Helicase [Gracilaria domingensis]|nr:Helicase [Gracilaria domingensis]